MMSKSPTVQKLGHRTPAHAFWIWRVGWIAVAMPTHDQAVELGPASTTPPGKLSKVGWSFVWFSNFSSTLPTGLISVLFVFTPPKLG